MPNGVSRRLLDNHHDSSHPKMTWVHSFPVLPPDELKVYTIIGKCIMIPTWPTKITRYYPISEKLKYEIKFLESKYCFKKLSEAVVN